jgi:hypothetical protein
MTVKDKRSRRYVLLDPASEKGEFKHIGGSSSDAANAIVFNQACKSLWTAHSDDETRTIQDQAVAATMAGIAPRDELEGMLAAQMIGIHSAAMEAMRRAMLAEQTFAGRQESLNQANKLSRTYTMLLDALNRHRGKGQQLVRVERVTVNEGGQAIVGVIGTSGGGAKTKSEEQSYAPQLADVPEPALWGENPNRDTLPVTRDGERAMPDARRD